MKTRVKSGLIMAPLLIVVWIGGFVLLAACILLSVFAMREFYKAFEIATADTDKPIRPSFKTGTAGALLLYASLFVSDDMIWAVVAVAMCFSLLFLKDERSVADCLVTMAGIFYIALFVCCIYRVDQLNQQHYIHGFMYNFTWLIVISAFATDIFAYFTGRAFGRHKLAPVLSPKKTVEGGIGGLIGSVVCCGLFGYFASPAYLIHCAVIGALGGVAAQAGDLTASAIKRRLGLKDYGSLIPGHGGLLDRIDSVLFTAPLVYIYVSVSGLWTGVTIS
jgi:phosphatidate cytidylyltransferase